MSHKDHGADAEYSIDSDLDDLRKEFDDAFDWEDDDTHRADTAYCGGGTGSAIGCCV